MSVIILTTNVYIEILDGFLVLSIEICFEDDFSGR